VNSITDEQGNALLEGVAFAAVAFGLVLNLGLNLFQMQEKALELQGLARNVMRVHLIHPEEALGSLVARWQALSPSWRDQELKFDLSCVSGCPANSVVWLHLEGSDLEASSFGVPSD